jgi:response regulator RpfG family c-di-GMP phosphodiesterase
LSLAEAFVRAPEPEDSLASVFAQSGRAFGPDMARLFTMWFHTTGGEPQPVSFPLEALGPVSSEDARDLLDTIADRVDDHNGVAGRWRRIARLTDAASELLRLSEDDAQALKIAVRFYGCGELGELVSSEPSFDPLARLGIDDRAAHGIAAADLLASNATLRSAASILRARGEWFDGTGKPDGLKHRAIPAGAPILAGAIAYDSLDHKDRIDTAAGTQFDPRAVRAILEAARTRA